MSRANAGPLDGFRLWFEPLSEDRKPKKVLTNLKHKHRLNPVIKLRKDAIVIKLKNKNYLQLVSLIMLSAAAVIGITNILGGNLIDAFVASVLVALLFVDAADIR